ncbi:hypothetical protein [Paraglaciecola sp. L3A3]|uniref:hypothetical protein n=1 Tax=Paraglaciecola sp. L3A3 TaxID=2686358 RepID=UPI00131AC174|nr:hypothetical protein [Paraglaciecola sp. L3A3]
MSYIQKFCESAIAKGDGTSSDDAKYFETMKNAIAQVNDQAELLALLEHKNDWVVSWTASHLLAQKNYPQALSALKVIVKNGGIIGLSAEVVIQEFEGGQHKSPFGFK